MLNKQVFLLLVALFLSQLERSVAFRPMIRPTIIRHPQRIVTPKMNMIDRFFRVLTSNINSFLRRMEDPEKVIEQAVIDMQSDLIRVRQSYAEITATLRRMEKQKEQYLANADEWYRRAQLALEKGDEDLAREALTRRQAQLENVESITKQLEVQGVAVGKLYSSMMALETKITEARRQKESMIARARTAKTSVNVNDMLNSLGDSSATEAFDRMKEKVEGLEMQAEIAGELAANTAGTTVGLERRFMELEGNSKVEDELNKLRKQLPRGVSAGSGFAQLPSSVERDAEYERLKRDMRR